MRRRVAALALLLLAGSAGVAAARPAPETDRATRAAPAPPPPAPRSAPRSAPTPAAAGTWPVGPPARVLRGFAPPAHPWESGHRGVDLQERIWAPVRAALGGVVRHAGPIAGRGVVVVGHGDTRTTYEPVRATVSVGDRVAAGDEIGRLQMAGSHCLPATCLHWGWRRGEDYLDPLALVGSLRVRLKPVGGPVGRPDAGGRS